MDVGSCTAKPRCFAGCNCDMHCSKFASPHFRYELMCRRRQDDTPDATLCDDPTGTLGSNTINQGDILAQSFAQAQCFAICPPHEANGNLGLLTPHSFNDWEHLPPVVSQLGLEGDDRSFATTGMESWMNSPGIYSTECDLISSMSLHEQATPPESSGLLPNTAFPPSSGSSAGLESRGSFTNYTLVLENIHSTEIGDVLNSLTERGLMMNMRILRQTT